MKKRIIYIILALTIILPMIFIPSTYAVDEKTQVKQLENDLDIIKKKQAEASKELKKAKDAKSNETEILRQQSNEISLIRNNIETTQKLLDTYTAEIENKEAEIARLEVELTKNIEIFKKRLVYNYENTGNVNFLEFVFESDNFVDCISRVEIAKELLEYDKKLITSISDNLKTQRLQKEEIQAASDRYTEHFMQLDAQEEELASKIYQSEATVAKFQSDIDKYEKEIAQANAEMNDTEQEMKRLMEIINSRNTPSYNYSDAGFIWPLPSRFQYISSYWGYRRDPFTGRQAYHNGLDIPSNGTSPEIYAIAGGEVVSVGGNPRSGYGYYVIINHGGGYQSLYGHMNQWPSVSAGDIVNQGQTIGYVGTTGRSTGKHLHFTLYINGKDVNPLSYLPH